MADLPETEAQFIARIKRVMRGRRLELGLTQQIVGRRLGRTQNYVSVRERGDADVSLADAIALASVLRLPGMGQGGTPAPSRKPPLTAPSWPTPRPLPSQMPKKASTEPAEAVAAKAAKEETAEKPVTFLWKEDLVMASGGNEAWMGLLAVDEDREGVLKLPLDDARRLKELLSLKLPHRDTHASSLVTTMLDRVNRGMSPAIAMNRRAKVMRLIQPEIMAVMTDVWAEVRDVKAGAKRLEQELLAEREKLAQRVEELKGRTPRATQENDEEKAKDFKSKSEQAERISALTKQLDDLTAYKATLEGKLQRLRKEVEEQDGVVEKLKKELKEREDNPSQLETEVRKAREEASGALEILDELWEMAVELRSSGSADNKMTGMAVQMKMQEMGYESE